jgi:uncharacterized protein with HEPN domain
MQREIQKFLFDIRESINSIADYLGEKPDFERYKALNFSGVALNGNWKSLERRQTEC